MTRKSIGYTAKRDWELASAGAIMVEKGALKSPDAPNQTWPMESVIDILSNPPDLTLILHDLSVAAEFSTACILYTGRLSAAFFGYLFT